MPCFPVSSNSMRWLEDILSNRFGHAWRLSRFEGGLRLQLVGGTGAIVFDAICDKFADARSDLPCTHWYAESEGWKAILAEPLPAPGISDLPSPLIEVRGEEYVIHYDILGLTYWMLTRVEEIGRTDLDNHERFPAISSHAFKYGYLERPIVDEWLYILRQGIQHVWPNLKLKQHEFSIKVSHDVDIPSFYAFKSWVAIGRMMMGHLLKRYDPKAFAFAPYVKLATRTKLHPLDPFNTFNWVMDQSEQHGLTSAFYFICGQTDPAYDADYEPGHLAIRELMRRIHRRGHEIGLHPSYNTFQKPDRIKQEADRMKQICEEEDIRQSNWGGRMHYLRWEHPTTLQAWENAGMMYDTTLGYADRPGFRCGTCFEYPAFDPIANKLLRLKIRPLIAMECTVIDNCYMGLGTGETALAKFAQLKNICRMVDGCYTLLWHNSQFDLHAKRELYQHVLAA